jgi:RND superfamily putative drug exporter
MASVLYRLGGWSYRRRRLVVVFWVGLLIGITILAEAIKGQTDSGFNVPGTPSHQALDVLAQTFPGTAGATARIVVAAPAEPRRSGGSRSFTPVNSLAVHRADDSRWWVPHGHRRTG